MFTEYHDSLIEAAALEINNALADFENKFAPIPLDYSEKWTNFLLDLIALGTSIVTGGLDRKSVV